MLTCADFEAAVIEAPAVVILVPAHEHVSEAGLAHTRGAEDDDPGAGVSVLIVIRGERSCNKENISTLLCSHRYVFS